ncbi:molybdate transport system ATP-binding protein [Saccharicrinis carchari]|uniref:Molybdate transport system ATP-binding protein n=1 Tax=Saccharicrinis carchari TaxID=1168039 RepID=A0A521CQ39_SACCC|nr:ATP-binding cassette domain-containing protein [Saccharicrinis carchari]SMO61567.1 molybdate transport system ATP-binding protein [Saccharicrinis carchari]
MKHLAIKNTGLSAKGEWMQQLLKGNGEIPYLRSKKGLLFSTVTLEKIIDEEIRHDNFLLTKDKSRSIRTYSSGEQRKALLRYQIAQKPDFLVLDNPFDCLDLASVRQLKNELSQVARQTTIVQLFKRQDDILPFISHALVMRQGGLTKCIPLADLGLNRSPNQQSNLNFDIPESIKPFNVLPQVLIKMNRVCVSYDNKIIVRDICWEIKQGEFWHLKGPNGSGKTTLLSMIYGDNPKAYGQDLFIFGHKKGTGESVWQLKEMIGYFTPSITDNFKGSHSAKQMIISGLTDSIGLYQKPSDRQNKLALDWLKVLAMEEEAHQRFVDLSQIKQRLVLIARAMIKHPPLLILDEPSTGLDDDSALLMVSLIQQIAQQSDTAILYVSHRTEQGLHPQYTFELIKCEAGFTGKVRNPK